MIELKSISKCYQKSNKTYQALRTINLHIKKGEIFGIIGPSGAGKSTLLRCVNALERPSVGSVLIDGVDLLKLSPEKLRETRRNIGMIFQHFNLLSSRTVYKNIAFPLEISGVNKEQIQEKVMKMAQLTGLETKLDQYPAQLSGGQKQRVAIARALIGGGKILLCDEATSSLDPETTRSILELLEKIRRELGVTILLITHEMQVIKSICDRVALIENGEIIEQGETAEIFSSPKTDTAKRFVYSTLHINLPEHLQSQLQQEIRPDSLAVLRLWFLKDRAKEAVISHMVKRFYVDINILQASIEYIHERLMGIMTITIEANGDKLQNCIAYLVEQKIKVEVIGYVMATPTSNT
ncbi:MAG: methionine ABC transporter ATP-binding protein [Gammaproteobacteria bacterium]|nr:methionine ABC transporter ATP-binding protein [Gammaproteobacteria bacterium]